MMIDYKNNYINLVVLGSFNPAILTHEFLVHECGFELPNGPDRKGPTMPVVASIDYNNLTFFADLGRLQITEKNIEDPKSSNVPNYTQRYLEKLPHTPITKCGANFSYTLSIERARLQQINKWISSKRDEFFRILKLKEIELEVSFALGQDKQIVKGWTLRSQREEYDAVTMLKVIYPEAVNQVKVDFNFEVDDLNKDRNRLLIITANFSKVFDIFKEQIEMIFSG